MTIDGRVHPPEGIDLSTDEFWARPLTERSAGFAQLRALGQPAFFTDPETPFTTSDQGYYALVSHADITEASRHPELFSSARGSTSIVDLPVEFNEYFGSMINMDDPRHARLRRIVSRAFTPKMIKRFEEDVQRTAAVIVDELIETGPCDFVEHVSARLPLKIICEMMGIGDEHYAMVLRNTNIILSGSDPEFVSQNMDEAIGQILTAGQDLANLVTGLAAERQEAPADDLTTALATANIDGEQLTPAELASFFVLLVVAGNETTRTAISHALNLLTEHPDQRELLLADLEGRIGGAVEEIVRYVSPVIWMRRSVTADCTLNGHQFREGDKAVLFYWAANRDETMFAEPDRFDITRSPNPHVGFGGAGPHFCLGAHLARREITAVLRELLSRVPQVRAAGEPDRLLSSFINGIKRLPCDLG
ncbi:MAG: cytochrome P450 [Streptosporangiaceae bacterium]